MRIIKRLDIDTYFMLIAKVCALRSTCIKRAVGCVIAIDKELVSTGYNGTVKGLAHCIDNYKECPRNEVGAHRGERYDLCPALHAEQNAIIQAAKSSKSINGGTAYITIAPCITCARMLVNAGITKVIMGDEPQKEVADLFKEVGIIYKVLEVPNEINFNRT